MADQANAGAQGAAGGGTSSTSATTQQQGAGSQQQTTQQEAASTQSGTQQQTTQTQQTIETAKETGAAKAKPGDQAQLDIKLPAGAKPNAKFVETITKAKLSQEQGQAVADYLVESGKAMEAALKTQLQGFEKTLRDDQAFGGTNYDKTVAARDSALKQFGDDETAKFLEDMGAKQHPGFSKMMAKIRALVGEDSVGEKGSKGGPAGDTREAELKRMFPNSPGMWVQQQ